MYQVKFASIPRFYTGIKALNFKPGFQPAPKPGTPEHKEQVKLSVLDQYPAFRERLVFVTPPAIDALVSKEGLEIVSFADAWLDKASPDINEVLDHTIVCFDNIGLMSHVLGKGKKGEWHFNPGLGFSSGSVEGDFSNSFMGFLRVKEKTQDLFKYFLSGLDVIDNEDLSGHAWDRFNNIFMNIRAMPSDIGLIEFVVKNGIKRIEILDWAKNMQLLPRDYNPAFSPALILQLEDGLYISSFLLTNSLKPVEEIGDVIIGGLS